MGSEVSITKLDHTGRVVLTYTGELEQTCWDMVIVRCVWTMPQAMAVGFLTFTTGDILLEHFYRFHWFNIFKLYSSRGQLKGWYCNLAEPVILSDTTISWRDLALDLVISPDGKQLVMDEDEFEALQPSEALRQTAQEVLAMLEHWVIEGHPPFINDEIAPPMSSVES